ncbi:L,D-transpeptidase [Rhizobium sp. CB3171]|uniref:L,D-transpeptidase n=1 Tax=unclassified Rhizobium TaxID=2613769 RepID=UPI000CDF3CB3|nr:MULTISPECIES: L,D-transpeptidase [Rhizobium]AVA19748.1 L,D-transpeptidase domain-containing protein [Rhizobium sp. NXC24]MDK4742765.1 L,D-transpeptidase [Rhizobium sp. CNPSo 3464]UWU21060.1 L,D-transpeptidase [Rhizobium tropici]WFU01844.1 L,D-transpeptidase [Rhizobium sp. CB3171]
MRIRNAMTALGLVATLATAGYATTAAATPTATANSASDTVKTFDNDYGVTSDNGFQLPAIPIQKVKPQFRRQIVSYKSDEAAGTIIVNTRERHLYYILGNNEAMRYGIGVGKQGFAWSGTAYVAWKQEWPSWHPPKEMAVRRPEIAKYVDDGMNPGLENPLGARAMYLYNEKGQDTLFRLHGTPEWASIGTAASSGCIRLMNQDVIDLYNRVLPGHATKVVVIQ